MSRVEYLIASMFNITLCALREFRPIITDDSVFLTDVDV